MDSKNNNEFLGLGTEENLKPLSNQEIKASRNTIKTKNYLYGILQDAWRYEQEKKPGRRRKSSSK